jgi:hypothetical protein
VIFDGGAETAACEAVLVGERAAEADSFATDELPETTTSGGGSSLPGKPVDEGLAEVAALGFENDAKGEIEEAPDVGLEDGSETKPALPVVWISFVKASLPLVVAPACNADAAAAARENTFSPLGADGRASAGT